MTGSFEIFFRENFGRTVVLLIAGGASRVDAEDAAQEAMSLALRKWESIREPAAWVRITAMRCYWRQVRKVKPEMLPVDAVVEPAADPGMGIFPEEQRRVLALLRALPDSQRTVMALYFDGFSCEEIVEQLGKPAATVRSHLRHARKTLREVIQSEAP